MKPTIDFLLSILTRYAAAHHVTLATVSTKLAGSGVMFARLKAGGGLTLARYNSILTHLATPAHWPDNQIPADLAAQLAPWMADASPLPSLTAPVVAPGPPAPTASPQVVGAFLDAVQ